MKWKSIKTFSSAALVGSVLLAGCGSDEKTPTVSTDPASQQGTQGSGKLAGDITVDGSSTVFLITQAVAEEFMKDNADVKISVGNSGTGGGFKKFVRGETDISDASRAIETEEVAEAQKNGVEFIELPIAFDGISVVVNPANTFATDLTVAELNKIWAPESKINNWKDVRAGFPDMKLSLFGPGTASGTFEYFNEAINGDKKKSRSDYSASEDDNVLVQGISGDKGALGYFGYAYLAENADKIKGVKVNGVAPTPETIRDLSYKPLSRPLFIYVSKKAIETKPAVQAFVKYYLTKGKALVETVHYVPFPDKVYELDQKRADDKKTGSLFSGQKLVGIKFEDVLEKEGK